MNVMNQLRSISEVWGLTLCALMAWNNGSLLNKMVLLFLYKPMWY